MRTVVGIPLHVDPSDFLHPVGAGTILGLLIGKPTGIFLGAWLAARTGLATKPDDIRWSQLRGAGIVCGIGFTMSFFISGLAFSDPDTLALAKLTVLATSVVAGLLGWFALYALNDPWRRGGGGTTNTTTIAT